VVNAVTGTLGSWQIGVAGDLQRYGTGIAKAVNTPVNTPSAPLVYWSDTPLELRSIGGNFSGGAISVAAHYAILDVPAALPSL
jgi:hypothetical protein